MYKYLELVLQTPGNFFGFIVILYVILYLPCNLIMQIAHKLIRANTVRKIGYPPPYCDADGDIIDNESDEKK